MTQLRRKPKQEFHYDEVKLFEDQEIGSGSYGKICKAVCDGLPCAAKLLHPALFVYNDPGNVVLLHKFEKECEVLGAMKHPCIVQYLATYLHPDTGQPILLMEMMDESLTRFLGRSQNPVPYHIQVGIGHDVALALSYLHSNSILHRDLSSNNVLMIAGSRAKVTDFGMSKLVEQQMSNPHMKRMTLCPGCPSYMPPEAFKVPPVYSEKLDVFSFGVLAIQIMTGKFPIVKSTSDTSISEVERRTQDINLIPTNHPLLSLALSCLKERDSKRPTASLLCSRLAGLKEVPEYSESVEKALRKDEDSAMLKQALEEATQHNRHLNRQLEILRFENQQLSRLLSSSFESPKSPTYLSPVLKRLSKSRSTSPVPNGDKRRSDYSDMDAPLVDLDDDEVELRLNLSAPPSQVWYHGRINRRVAATRLEEVGQPGAYLIRDSESEPGSFVLSFLDHDGLVFHYRINCQDGQYNTAGQSNRWFSSLQTLLGYYMKYSTVRKNQHLGVPVSPPEIVPLPR